MAYTGLPVRMGLIIHRVDGHFFHCDGVMDRAQLMIVLSLTVIEQRLDI